MAHSQPTQSSPRPHAEQALQFGPLAITVWADNNPLFKSHAGGIYSSLQANAVSGGLAQEDHAVALVGYTPDAWIIQNSWGATWGDAGYISMKREPWVNGPDRQYWAGIYSAARPLVTGTGALAPGRPAWRRTVRAAARLRAPLSSESTRVAAALPSPPPPSLCRRRLRIYGRHRGHRSFQHGRNRPVLCAPAAPAAGVTSAHQSPWRMLGVGGSASCRSSLFSSQARLRTCHSFAHVRLSFLLTLFPIQLSPQNGDEAAPPSGTSPHSGLPGFSVPPLHMPTCCCCSVLQLTCWHVAAAPAAILLRFFLPSRPRCN